MGSCKHVYKFQLPDALNALLLRVLYETLLNMEAACPSETLLYTTGTVKY
jgi:hypothetical protein